MSFQFQNLPTKKDEAWKYTSLKALEAHSYEMAEPVALSKTSQKEISEVKSADFTNLIFVNGHFDKALSDSMPAGVLLLNDKQKSSLNAFAKARSLLSKNLRSDRLDDLNLNQAKNGFVMVIAGAVQKPLHLIHVVNGSSTVNFSKNALVLAKKAKASLIETYLGFGQGNVSHFSTEILLKEKSKLEYLSCQTQNLSHTHLGRVRVFLKSLAEFRALNFSSGAALARNNFDIHFLGYGAEAILNGVYLLSGQQHIDNHTLIHHQLGANKSEQFYKGLLLDQARAVFDGLVLIDPGAQKANSQQLVKNLLLSSQAEADSKPQLEIYADDVKASHGSTVGPLSAEETFYLQSRGISKDEATRILSHGFVQDLIDRVPSQLARKHLKKNLELAFERVKS